MTTDNLSATQRSCPSDEFLIAALSNVVSDDEQRWFDAHLDTCDRCLDAVGAAMRRLRIASDICATVPSAVHQRAAAAAAAPEPATAILPGPRPVPARVATAALATRWFAGVRDWVSPLLRPGLAIPAAVAVVAVLVVTTQSWMTPGTPRSLTRSIALPQRVRVTAIEVPVRRLPNDHAEVVATVARGTLVEISGEERDWSHVRLPNGSEGWVDQGALR